MGSVKNPTESVVKIFAEFSGLECPEGDGFYPEALALNLARNALRLVLRAYRVQTLFMPAWSCPVLADAARLEGTNLNFYALDAQLSPLNLPEPHAWILYPNYFGLRTHVADELAHTHPNLILDNAQAFFAPQCGRAAFYSARKFFGVPDGAYLFGEKAVLASLMSETQAHSYKSCAHLLKYEDLGALGAYERFIAHEDVLNGVPMMRMSRLTEHLLSGIDYERVKARRKTLFQRCHAALKAYNELDIFDDADAIPMAYPLLNRKLSPDKLSEAMIFSPQFWQGTAERLPHLELETRLEAHLVALPLHQRLTDADLDEMVRRVKTLLDT